VTDLGRPAEWGRDTVVVLDNATAFAGAALRRVQALAGNAKMTSAMWGAARQDFTDAIQLMTRDNLEYHFIMLGHLQMIGPEDFIKQGDSNEVKQTKLEAIEADMIPTRLYPIGVTKPHSQSLHKDFSTMLLATQKQKLGRKVRVLQTTSGMEIDLKVPARAIKAEYPLETGLAEIFEAFGHTAPGFSQE
jgi:hypothetical protein